MSQELQQIKERIKTFTEERDWSQFHNAKDLALALSIEASELNECFLWKSAEQGDEEKIREELADVLLNIQQVMYLFSDEKVEELIKSIQSYKTNRWWRRTFISQEEN